MAVRSILNHCVHKLRPYRQFSSSSTIISKNSYKSSLPILSTPWLMLPPDVKDGPNGPSDNYFNIIDKSIVKIDRPLAHGSVPFNTKCVGSAKGWVAFEFDSDGSLFLANPYTEARCHKLPPLKFPKYRQGLHFTLAGDPMSENFSLIEEKRELHNKLCLAAYNRKADTLYKLHFEDDNRKLQFITRSYPFEDDETGDKRRALSLSLYPEIYKVFDKVNPWDYNVEVYLVVTEGNNSRLFLVIRHLAKKDEVGCETKDIKLLKIDLEGEGEVEYVESIDDQALFIGTNSEPFFISTHNGSGIKSNCVYVADDLGYYDLETKCITPFLSLGDLADVRPQVYWVAPPSFA
ncbi:uncharacterized protein LOC141654991 [Silene latifolia]|uniref:uncharacterized protein LOC141654991 n=1 Tax=Silene latifolia TaxID=37657 RepID=UPI003D77EC6F